MDRANPTTEIPTTTPVTRQGFRSAGLAKVRGELESAVGAGYAPGCVALVDRQGETEAFAVGALAFGDPRPIPRNALFRIASMTKAVTALAAMMLVEDGAIGLDEPVDRLLPELAERRVLRRPDGPLDDTVPARRPITIEDLMSFRLGWGIALASEPTPIQRRIAELGIVGFGMPNPAMPFGPDEWLARLATLPLMAQPGEAWLYTTGSDVLGVLIARAEGRDLAQVLQDRIFRPLGMVDTGFFAPPEKLDRFATAYWGAGATPTVLDPPNGAWSRPPRFPEGDSGLVSTADDFLIFARMLMAGGVHEGQRLISEASARAIATDHLTPEQRAGGRVILGENRGWGYGVSVLTGKDAQGVSAGAYGWNGGLGTSWINDPAEDLVMILLTQRAFASPEPPALHKVFQRAVYAALA